MKGVWRRSSNSIVPADEDASESLAAMKEKQEIVLDVHSSRNVRFHRLVFGVLNRLVDGGLFDNVDSALTALKIGTHEVDTWIDPHTGNVYYIPRSISFEKMGEAKFRRFWKRAEFVICTQWLEGDHELMREVEHILDGPDAIGERVSPAELSTTEAT